MICPTRAGLPFLALLLLGQSAFAASVAVGSPPALDSGVETCPTGGGTYGYTDADGTAVTGLCVGGGDCTADANCNAGFCLDKGSSKVCQCKTGAIGLACSDCKEGYVMNTTTNECVRCPGDVTNPCNENGLDGFGNPVSAYDTYPASSGTAYNTCSWSSGTSGTCACATGFHLDGATSSCVWSGASGYDETSVNLPTEANPTVMYVDTGNNLHVLQYFKPDDSVVLGVTCAQEEITAKFVLDDGKTYSAAAANTCKGTVTCLKDGTCTGSIDVNADSSVDITASLTANSGIMDLVMPMKYAKACGFESSSADVGGVTQGPDTDETYEGTLVFSEKRQCVSNMTAPEDNQLPPSYEEAQVVVYVTYPYVESDPDFTVANDFVSEVAITFAAADPHTPKFDTKVRILYPFPYEVSSLFATYVLTKGTNADPNASFETTAAEGTGLTLTTGGAVAPYSRTVAQYIAQDVRDTRTDTFPGSINSGGSETGYLQCFNAKNPAWRTDNPTVDLISVNSEEWICEQVYYFAAVEAPCDSEVEILITAEFKCIDGITECDTAAINAQYPKQALTDLPSYIYANGDWQGSWNSDANLFASAPWNPEDRLLIGFGKTKPVTCPDAYAVPVLSTLDISGSVATYIPEDTVEFVFSIHTLTDVISLYAPSYCYLNCDGGISIPCIGANSGDTDLEPVSVYPGTSEPADEADYTSVSAWSPYVNYFAPDSTGGRTGSYIVQLTMPSVAELNAAGTNTIDGADTVSCKLTMGADFDPTQLDWSAPARRLQGSEVASSGLRGTSRHLSVDMSPAAADYPRQVRAVETFSVKVPATYRQQASGSSKLLSTGVSALAGLGAAAILLV